MVLKHFLYPTRDISLRTISGMLDIFVYLSITIFIVKYSNLVNDDTSQIQHVYGAAEFRSY